MELLKLGNDTVPTGGPDIVYKDLISVVLQCFLIIFIGYLSGKVGFLSESEAKGLGKFVSGFSLPALIFSSLATSDLDNVKWGFLASVLISKTAAFMVVALVTLILTKPPKIGLSGLYAIFSTQSNDFALGYPLLKSLYKSTHPHYAQYIYFLAPIQLVILNPVGLLLMEIHRQQQNAGENQSVGKLIFRVIRGIFSNPIIIMTCLGIIWNVSFNHQMPSAILGLLEVFGSAFSATALFLLGLNMVNKVTLLQGPPLLIPGILIALKNLIMPLIIRQMVYSVCKNGNSPQEINDLGNLGFLYGTFPAAPTVFIFALQFDLAVEVISVGMVASTILAAPFMFLSANMIQMTSLSTATFQKELARAMTYISIISALCCVWVFIVFLIGKRWKRVTHGATLVLIFFQFMAAFGGILWSIVDLNNTTLMYVQFVIALTGTLASRLWTALLALILVLLQWRSLCFVLRVRHSMMIFIVFLTVGLVIFMTAGMGKHVLNRDETDPSFQFGRTQAAVALSVIVVSLIMTVLCLILQQRHYSVYSAYEVINYSNDSDVEDEVGHSNAHTAPIGSSTSQGRLANYERILPDLEDLSLRSPAEVSLAGPSQAAFPETCGNCFSCSSEQQKQCTEHVQHYFHNATELSPMVDVQETSQEEDHQVTRHTLLVLLLSLSMIFGLAACIWKLVGAKVTGIFLELEFVDIFLNYGQGIFTFLIFGLDTKLVVRPCIYLWHRLRFGQQYCNTPSNDFSQDPSRTCDQFRMYHLSKCVEEITFEHQIGCVLHADVFYGRELVDWLIAAHLTHNRQAAERYGNQLMMGGLIEHIRNQLPFHDSAQLYRFVTRPRINSRTCS